MSRRLLETGWGSRTGSFGATEWLLLAGVALIWGSSFLFIDIGLQALEPGVIAVARVALGVAALSLVPAARRPIGRETELRLRDDLGAAAWDVFGTANFLNFRPWTASVEYLLGLGIERVAAWDQALVERFLQGLDPDRYRLVSPRQGPPRSTLVVFGHREADRTEALFERLTAAGVDVALRRGQLRISPHLYNTEADIDRALEVLGGRVAPVESG